VTGINTFDDLIGKPDDHWNSRYSVATSYRATIYAFLLNYSTLFDIQTFFEVIKQQFPEDIIRFIVEYLVPAKSSVESGLIVENDMLEDKKYA